jgi:ribosome assembly protein 4
LPYSFQVDQIEVIRSIYEDLIQNGTKSTEDSLTIIYHPQAVFRVRAVTRCSSTLTGHTEALLSCRFSPDGQYLATGSGDTTVRLWDLNTETPQFTCQGHSNWVLCLEWAPDSSIVASGSMDQTVRLWDPKTGQMLGNPLKGHRKWVTSIAWEPFHINPKNPRLATASKDGTVRIWDTVRRTTIMTFASHTSSVTCVKWGGGNDLAQFPQGIIYTTSQDRTVKLWNPATGAMIKSLSGHAHWVNTIALNTDYVLRTGQFDHTGKKYDTPEEGQVKALERYNEVVKGIGERIVTGSDDFTMFLWDPLRNDKPLARMTGHQKAVNHVNFSPDGRLIASASFDNSVKIWDSNTGKFVKNLRGHVSSVYQVCWSSDSRMLVSASKDATCKVWDYRTGKLKVNLPGHLDEVYAIDWSPGGDKVASGGKDRTLKLWRY